MEVAIIGWWGRGNMGDDLILANLVRWLAPHRCYAVTDHPVLYPPELDVITFAEFDERAGSFDLVVFGGGGVLNDRYVRSVLPPERVTKIRSPLYALAVGVPTADWLEDIEYFFERCDVLSVRDERARSLLLSRHPDLDAIVVPDPGYLTEPAGVNRNPLLIGLTIRTLARAWLLDLPDDAITRVSDAFVRALSGLRERGLQPTVFAHEPRDLELYASLGADAVMLNSANAAREIARAGALVTMRLHGGIVAFTQGTPVRVVDYQAKCTALDDAVGGGLRIDPRAPDLIAGALDALAEGPEKHADLVERMRGELAAFRAAHF